MNLQSNLPEEIRALLESIPSIPDDFRNLIGRTTTLLTDQIDAFLWVFLSGLRTVQDNLKQEYEGNVRKVTEEKDAALRAKDSKLRDKEAALQINNAELTRLRQEQQKLGQDKQRLKQEKQQLEQEKQQLEQEKQQLEQEKQRLELEKQQLEQEKQGLEQQKQQLEQDIQSLSMQLADEKKERVNDVQKLKEQLQAKQDELNAAHADTEAQKARYDQTVSEQQQQLSDYEKHFAPFSRVLDAMLACESMKNLLTGSEITDKGLDSLFQLIRRFGNQFELARKICQAMYNYKKENQWVPITAEETDLIATVNQFYRDRDGKTDADEILFVPTGSVFDDKLMTRIEGGINEKAVAAVYSPCCRKSWERAADPLEKARVKTKE